MLMKVDTTLVISMAVVLLSALETPAQDKELRHPKAVSVTDFAQTAEGVVYISTFAKPATASPQPSVVFPPNSKMQRARPVELHAGPYQEELLFPLSDATGSPVELHVRH